MIEKPRVIVRPGAAPVVENKEFLFGKENLRLEGLSSAAQDYRQRAWEAYKSSEYPDQNTDSWKRSNLKGFYPSKYQTISIPSDENPKQLTVDLELNRTLGKLEISEHGTRYEIQEKLTQKGIEFITLTEAERQKTSALDEIIGKVIDPGQNIFTAMAASFAQFGSLINIPGGLILDEPLVIKIAVGGNEKAFFSHHLIQIGRRSQAVIILENIDALKKGGDCFHSGIVEIILEEGAKLTFVELQSLNKATWNFGFTKVRIEKDASIDWIIGSTGAKFSKVFSEMQLTGEGSHGKASGFYFADGQQLIDHETRQDHFAPNTTSDLLFKGALKDYSRSVWRGMIHVAPEAVKTDGYQANRNLILSDTARADSIPGLEILTDDVRCTHGATVGKIDQDQVFYLESRGIPKKEAENLIVEGFFESVLERIPLEDIRHRFKQSILHKMTN